MYGTFDMTGSMLIVFILLLYHESSDCQLHGYNLLEETKNLSNYSKIEWKIEDSWVNS